MAEVVAFEQRPNPAHAELDRTPPQDLAAEMSVLGAMLMSKDAVSDVVEIVRGTDFYRPAHEFISMLWSTCTAAVSRLTQ